MSKVYIYVVDRDFGFAPNPYHGCCTLATCKPGIRQRAAVGDWIIGMGGARLNATGRCVFAMRTSAILTFNQYWSNPAYLDKKPVRNGSRKMLVGDNIYHLDANGHWHQADSHHSYADGTANLHNLKRDTTSDKVLVSRHFYYFGSKAVSVPRKLLGALGYRNGRNYRVFNMRDAGELINWFEGMAPELLNVVAADPFDFAASEKRYSVKTNSVR